MSLFPIQPGSIKNYTSLTIPSSTTKFGTHFSHFGIGGYVEVPTIAFRNAIPISSDMNADKLSSGRRKLGMVVYVHDDRKFYQLLPKHSATSGGPVGSLVTLAQWNAASNAQRMVWLDPTKSREDKDGPAPTYAVITGSGIAADAWLDVTPALATNFDTLSGNWQSTFSTVSSLSSNWQTTFTTVCTNSASWDQTRLDLSNYLPLTGGTIDGNLSVHGNFFVTGSSALISAVNLVVNDSLIYVAADNPSDSLDIGIVGAFTETPIGYQHTGLVRLHDTNEWSLFSGLTTEPASATAISRTDPTFKIDTLNANLKGNLLANTNVFGYLSSNGVLYANGGDSNLWNTSYTTVCSNSAKWETAYDSIAGNILQKGNSFGESVVIGSNDQYSLVLETSGTPRMVVLSSGNVGIGNQNPNNTLTVSGDISANNLKLTSATAATSGIQFGTDTNLYRAGANRLKTDDAFECPATSNVTANVVLVQGTNNAINSRTVSPTLWTVGDTVSSLSGNWNSVFTTVSTNSATWATAGTSVLSALSANWQSTFTTVSTASAKWDSVYTTVYTKSAAWDSVYTTVKTNSATEWNNEVVKSFVNVNYLPLSGGTITGNLSVNEKFTAFGDISSTNTVYASGGNSTTWNAAVTSTPGSGVIKTMIRMTNAQFTALAVKDPFTLYIIV